MPLAGFHPLVQQWFNANFAGVSEPQRLGWPEIAAGRDVLISAPTGSGKTLAAFLHAINKLVTRAVAGDLPDETQVVYVSPLKALSNDVHKNLQIPLDGIRALGTPLQAIRVAVRTGDTAAWERQAMLKHAPHVLVTTPASLYILLTADKSRAMLRNVSTLIVDEVHAVAGSKRGSHLALSIARLQRLAVGKLQKIGLSATVKPIEEVAQYLGAHVSIIQSGHRRAMDLAVEVPRDELGPVASGEMWAEMYERAAALIQQHRTTLIFVNTRRQSERIAHELGLLLGPNIVLPHHGSLSRKLRLEAEQKLKNGELRAVVATASLELGIDIGTIDLVLQCGSPRSIAAALQRIGRAGHSPAAATGALPKGRFFATTRDELVECGAVVRAIRKGELDRLEIPRAPLDILAQQITAMSACEEWGEDELFHFATATLAYRDLERKDFDNVLEMLGEGIATDRGRRGALIHRDQVNHRVKGRRGARLTAITNGGAIPDTAQYQVVAEPEGFVVGSVDEDFAVESMAGDVFLLGTSSWRIRRVEPGRVRVEDAHGAAPSIPFWRGEAPGRTRELSEEVGDLRAQIIQRPNAVEFLMSECAMDQLGAEQAAEYVRAGAQALGALPDQNTIVAERFFDEAGGMQLIVHSPFGARINRAWGLALRKRFCRTFNFELQAAATDNGFLLSLSDQHSFPLELIFEFLKADTVTHVLEQALLGAPMFGARWKWNASRSLAVPRFAGGRKVPPPLQRMRADDLLASVFPDQAACAENLAGEIRVPQHPLVKETIANCMHEAMDLNGLVTLLRRVEDQSLRTVAIDTREASPFSHEILNANPYAFLDDAPLEERRARAVALRRTLPATDSGSLGRLDPEAIAQVAEESCPVVLDADELHDALLTLVLLPPVPTWIIWFEELRRAGRACLMNGWWVATERLEKISDLVLVLRGWSDSIGPFTAKEIASRLNLAVCDVEVALAKIESEGIILRGNFTNRQSELEYCHRRVLARIHRMTLGRLRREIEPATAADFMRFLARWQHLAPGARLHGVDGVFQVIKQLEGYEISAAAWETTVLPQRIHQYDPEWLDRLCLAGEISWGRLSPHPALESLNGRKVRPTRVAPLAIFLREHAADIVPEQIAEVTLYHSASEVYEALKQRGASFFNDLVRATGRLASEVEDGLWELAAAGKVTADGFENLRALIDPKRRKGEGRGRSSRPRHAVGRWDLLVRSHSSSALSAVQPEFFARLLLDRWGVVFRDVLARETLAPAWRTLLGIYRLWEARGEVRGGRFVSGFSGEQFARPEAVDLIRTVRRNAEKGEELSIALSDPLNLTGILLPGARTSPLAQGWLHLRDGVEVKDVSNAWAQRFGLIS